MTTDLPVGQSHNVSHCNREPCEIVLAMSQRVARTRAADERNSARAEMTGSAPKQSSIFSWPLDCFAGARNDASDLGKARDEKFLLKGLDAGIRNVKLDRPEESYIWPGSLHRCIPAKPDRKRAGEDHAGDGACRRLKAVLRRLLPIPSHLSPTHRPGRPPTPHCHQKPISPIIIRWHTTAGAASIIRSVVNRSIAV
jgi:hypothetical protein